MGRLALRTTGVALVVFAVAAFAFLAIGPRTGRYRTLTVLTSSMRPSYPAGSVLVVVPRAAADVAVGDVLTYSIPVEDHRVITHRVVEVVEPGVVRTKGDANDVADPWVAKIQGDTAWTVRAGVPLVGFALSFLRQPLPRALGTLLPLLVVTVMGLGQIWRRHPSLDDDEPAAAHAAASSPPAPVPRQSLVYAGTAVALLVAVSARRWLDHEARRGPHLRDRLGV